MCTLHTSNRLLGGGDPFAVFLARAENDSFGSLIAMYKDSAWPTRAWLTR